MKDVAPKPEVKDENIACPNPECKNHHQKVLPPTTKFCPECGTKIVAQQNNPQPQQPANPTYVIDPKLDKYEKDGVVYYKVASANQDEENHSLCYHEENGCRGEMYLGNNGILICGKCGEKKIVQHSQQIRLVAADIIQKEDVDTQWFIELLASINNLNK